MNLIKSGRIVLSTSWGSMHTDFMGDEELNRICYDYVNLEKSYGIHSEVAYMNDVPGHPMSVASVLADSGTKYLGHGCEYFYLRRDIASSGQGSLLLGIARRKQSFVLGQPGQTAAAMSKLLPIFISTRIHSTRTPTERRSICSTQISRGKNRTSRSWRSASPNCSIATTRPDINTTPSWRCTLTISSSRRMS